MADADVRNLVDVGEDARPDRLTGERFEGGGTDEVQGRFGGNHPNGVPRFGELTDHRARLVGGYAACDAHDDPFALGHVEAGS